MKTTRWTTSRISPLGISLLAIPLLASGAYGQPADHPDGDLVPWTDTRPASEVVLSSGGRTYSDRDPECGGGLWTPGQAPEGDGPSGATFSADGSLIIVAHRESRNLIVWNASTRAFVRAIPVTGSPQSVAVNAAGIAVTANVLEDTASIINIATGQELAVVPVGRVPGIVQITADGQTAVVGNTTSSDFSIIDIAGATEVRRIAGGNFAATTSVNPESGAFSLYYSAFTLNGRSIVHPRRFQSSVAVIDIDTGALMSIPTVAGPTAAAVYAGGTRAYVSHWLGNRTITDIDLATNTIVRTLTTSVDLGGPLACNPSGSKLAVAIQNAAVVIDTVAGTAGATLATASINEMYTTADGNHAFCVGFNGSLISLNAGTLLANTNAAVSTSFGCVSPVGARSAAFSNVFGEDMVVANLNPAAPAREAFILSGPAVEADRCRTAAISPDGSRALGVSIFSDTASMFDANGALLATFTTGQRPSDVGFTPDGRKAAVCSLDDAWATIIDVQTLTSTNVTISRRASWVRFSPDSRYAYISVLADGDGLWRIDLTTNTVAGPKLLTADMGSVGYGYQQNSQVELSPDGTRMAVCGGFGTPAISVVDVVNWSIVATVPVPAGNQPTCVSWAPDGTKFYVSYRDTDQVAEFSNASGSWAAARVFAVGDMPFVSKVSDDGSTLWLLNYSSRSVARVDLTTGAMTVVDTYTDSPIGLALVDDSARVVVAHGNSSVTVGGAIGVRFDQSGEAVTYNTSDNTRTDTVNLHAAPSGLVATADGRLRAAPCPGGDGLFAMTCPIGCPTDFNNDGGVDGDDVIVFFALWDVSDVQADMNDDGGVDGDDVILFFFLWDSGC
ncbi:MAG: GC-type dockerin domain-anchored protein [Phycisphaerales bacterium]